ncbi:hypothetical protein HS088_TW14G00942 [Tripterygium wilfordii]|uniref:Uncharacterized protein n=1 Tax=Tripterygium wilfordii TaxID=458696 RepID=A0A7J7CS12_TRIWF|nr:uncharacterized protein LOC120015545 [Tripterygium wilfordii]KAF5736788.1 hypothetical protein HS088_TW14G00942 [Tripterygium wilfordii]
MKIQPIDSDYQQQFRPEPAKPVLKSRLKRLFDRQFRVSSADKPGVGDQTQYGKDGTATHEFEPSSVCLAKMVQNYIEESNEKQLRGRNRCNCFNGNGNDSSDDEFDAFGESINGGSSGDACELLKTLIPCPSVVERNLLADTAMIVEKNKNQKRKDDLRKIVVDDLFSLGYDSSICKSKWDKSPSFPAGEYEYIDVIVEGERLLVDIDFRSEFEIARSTGSYDGTLQSVPYIFVGKADRLGQIVSIVSEAAKQSLKKKGMHFPPWRKAEYIRAKWLSPYTRGSQNDAAVVEDPEVEIHESPFFENETAISEDTKTEIQEKKAASECGELDLIFGEVSETEAEVTKTSESSSSVKNYCEWQPPTVKPRSCDRSARIVTGLASLFKEKP